MLGLLELKETDAATLHATLARIASLAQQRSSTTVALPGWLPTLLKAHQCRIAHAYHGTNDEMNANITFFFFFFCF